MLPGIDTSDIRHGEIRKTKLIDQELTKLRVDIAALQETRIADCGSIREKNFTFFWQGLPSGEPRHHGVGFAIRNELLAAADTPIGVNERLMTLRVHIPGGHATLICVYAPTLAAEPDVKDAFYGRLREALDAIPQQDQVYLLGDFNARVGRDSAAWPDVVGHFGVGNVNENGQRLLEFCAEKNLAITNTYFGVKPHRRVSWRHPRSGHWHQIDLIVTKKQHLKSCRLTRSYHSADCCTDHSLVISRVNLRLNKTPRSFVSQKRKINISATKDAANTRKFSEDCRNKLDSLHVYEEGEIDASWRDIAGVIYDCATAAYGTTRSSNKDWVEENLPLLLPLIEKKREAMLIDKQLSTQASKKRLKQAKSEVQRASRKCANNYWQDLCGSIQAAFEQGNLKEYYSLLKVALGPSISKSAALKSKEGLPIVDKSQQLERWVEHYSDLYARADLTRQHAELHNYLPALSVMWELDAEPTQEELRNAIAMLPNGKSPGEDGIPGEVLKVNSTTLLPSLHQLLLRCWAQGRMPQDMRDALITTLYKNKGDKGCCDNYRGISLLSVAGKAFAKVLLKRLQILAERVLPETQCGFRAQRSTIDMIFTLRQLQEKCREQRRPLLIAFIDLAKAFDTVCRPALFDVLRSVGCPPKLLELVSSFHEDMKASIIYNGSKSNDFFVKNGVKQGCVLAPTLFGIYFSVLLGVALEGVEDGVFIRTRADGSLFNLSRLRSQRHTYQFVCRELLFADDAAIVSHDEQSLQAMMNRLSWACDLFSLTISVRKTEILVQGVEDMPNITLGSDALTTSSNFTYLGSVITQNLSLDDELSCRIGKAATTFGRLSGRVWNNHKLTTKTKVLVFQSCILSTLLYGSETWTLYSKQEKRLCTFYMRNLRKLLNIKWQDKVTNTEVLARAGLPSMPELLRKSRLRWLGHVNRMAPERLPRQVLYGELATGTRAVGRPKLRYKDVCKATLKDFHIEINSWQNISLDRNLWRHATHNGMKAYAGDLEQRHQIRRTRRHESRNGRNSAENVQFVCVVCQRACLSRIGLISHERACRRNRV